MTKLINNQQFKHKYTAMTALFVTTAVTQLDIYSEI